MEEGATYIRHDGHHAGHWPTFLVIIIIIIIIIIKHSWARVLQEGQQPLTEQRDANFRRNLEAT